MRKNDQVVLAVGRYRDKRYEQSNRLVPYYAGLLFIFKKAITRYVVAIPFYSVKRI
jgi:hypothetical protein